MDLEKSLFKYIVMEAEKLGMRHHAYHNAIAVENTRKRSRLKNPRLVKPVKPEHWEVDKKFNPFYVKKNAKSIAKSMARKISKGSYGPFPSVTAKIPKASGGTRNVTMYQIPDAAVSKLFYHRLLKKIAIDLVLFLTLIETTGMCISLFRIFQLSYLKALGYLLRSLTSQNTSTQFRMSI